MFKTGFWYQSLVSIEDGGMNVTVLQVVSACANKPGHHDLFTLFTLTVPQRGQTREEEEGVAE